MIRSLACVAALLAVNLTIAGKLLTVEYLPYMGSIEGAYIGLARYILEHWGQFGWFPLWYCGIPYENTYPPVTHFLTAGVAWVGGVSPAWAHHIVGASVYCLGPVGWFALAWRFSGDRLTGLACGLAYSLLPFSNWLLPSVGGDVGALLGPRRLQALVVYGEAPHATGMALIPLALIALDRALERPGGGRVSCAVLALSAVVLSNWLAAFALAIAVAAYLAAKFGAASALRGAGIGAVAYLTASPWIPPSNIADVRRNAQQIGGDFTLGWEQAIYGAMLLAVLAALAFAARRAGFFLRFASLFAAPMAVLPLMADWTGAYILPQPLRYSLEMDMGLSLLAGWAFARLNLRRPRAAPAAGLVLVVLLIWPAARYGSQLIRDIDIESTVEYQTARWLDQNLSGQRIFTVGSTQFWLDAFADNPQVGGGFDQGISNPQIHIVRYGIPFTENDGEDTAVWLRAYGARAVVVQGPETRDAYPAYRDPHKFDGILKEIWREGGDAIYEVPMRSDSLAHAIRPGDVVSRAPVNNIDLDQARAYVLALEDDSLPLVAMEWTDASGIVLDSSLEPNHLVSVQVTYRPGWRAQVDGRAIPIERDGLGFMVLTPNCQGPCEIELTYDGGFEMRVAKTLSLLCLMGLAGWTIYDRRLAVRRRSSAT